MISISFISFLCYLPLGEQPAITDHIEDVHGVEEGIESLKEMQVIEVDTKIAFSLPSILDIELMGPDKRANLFNSVYLNCVSRNVVRKSTNKDQSDLNLSRIHA